MSKKKKICMILIPILWSFSKALSTSKFTEDATSNSVHELAVEMLEKCYGSKRTAVVHGDLDESAIGRLSSQLSLDIIHYSDAINHRTEHPNAADLFLITANSGRALGKRLATLRATSWWNSMATFFIVPEGSKRSCSNVKNILLAAWQLHVVTGFLLCENSPQKLAIFTYNPYTNRAPRPWRQSRMVQGGSGRWTLYKSHLNPGHCPGQFDRTKSLDGSKLRLIVNKNNATDIPTFRLENSTFAMFRFDGNLVEAMMNVLNISVDIVELILYNPNWEGIHPCFRRLANFSADLSLCMRSPDDVGNFTPTYITAKLGFTVITQHRGLYTPLEKMWNYYGPVTVISMAVILAMTFAVVWRSDKYRRLSFAGFEVLRLIINTAINTRLDTLSKRIFFLCIFLYFLIMQATFSGRISAFLTKDQPRKNVESLEDLRDSRYTKIYSDSSAVKFIIDPEVQKKIVIPPILGCHRQVRENKENACIGSAFFGVFDAIRYKLHFMKRFFGLVSPVYATRHDFPLKHRVDFSLMLLEQSGLSHRWSSAEVESVMTKYRAQVEKSLVNIRPISLHVIFFAFYILAFGLTVAVICFIFEIRKNVRK